jgi:hypothetical protein
MRITAAIDLHVPINQVPEVHIEQEPKAWRHHSDHGVRQTVQMDRAADYTGIATEPSLPKAVVDHYDSTVAT